MKRPNQLTPTGFKSCFISAAVGQNISLLHQLLAEYNIEVFNLEDAAVGDSFSESAKLLIRKADFAIYYLSKDSNLASIYFEIGIACGLDKPIFLVVDPEVNTPHSIDSFHRARTATDNRDALRFHLEAFLKHNRKSKTLGTKSTSVNPIEVNDLRQKLPMLEQTLPRMNGRELEKFVANVFKRMGAQTSEPVAIDDHFDLAVWIDGIEPVIQNPILVEIKLEMKPGDKQQKIEEQFRLQLKKVRGEVGLIIYLHGESMRVRGNAVDWPLVVYFSVEEFLKLANSGHLAKAIRQARNECIHRGSPED